MACVTARIKIPEIEAQVSLPELRARVETGQTFARAQIGRVADAVEVWDPHNILTVAEDEDGAIRLGVSGAEGCDTPETGASISIPLRDLSGRTIGPMADGGPRSPLMGKFEVEEVLGWASKAAGSGGAYWVGIADGPISEAANGMFWCVLNNEAGKQRVALQRLVGGVWQPLQPAPMGHEDIVGCSGGGGTNRFQRQMGVAGWTAPLVTPESTLPLSSHSYWVNSSDGVLLSPGTVPHLAFGAGCDGTPDEVTVKPRGVAVVTTDLDRLVPSGSPPTYVPTRRVFPSFGDALAHEDRADVLASATDLANGVKRIAFNAPSVASPKPTDGAFWVWPLEDVFGVEPTDPATMYDLRVWDGRPWVEIVKAPTVRPTAWWVAVGFMYGSDLDSSLGFMAGITWSHVWGYPFPRLADNSGTGWRASDSGSTHVDGALAHLDWVVRGQWIAFPHANLYSRHGQPFPNYVMAGGQQLPIEGSQPGKKLHMVLAAGNVTGAGVADEILIRPAHNFRVRRTS